MAAGQLDPAVQLVQTRFRLHLVDGWNVAPGSNVLEIGCGQGDLTAVLADAVGPAGHVLAVDLADPGYGSPVTLGESAAFLHGTPLGERIDFRFGFDVLDPTNSFPDDAFDHVVLAHCSWYFESLEQLRHVFRRVRPWSKHLDISEWDLRPHAIEQLPHLLAVLIQGQIEATGARGEGNIRTPYSRDSLDRMLAETGWRIAADRLVDTSTLQDADWEIGACLAMVDLDGRLADIPPLNRDLLHSQVDVLRATALPKGNRPLPSYAITAKRA